MDLYVTGQGKSKLNGSYVSMFAAEGKESEGRVTTRTEWLLWASWKRWAWWRESLWARGRTFLLGRLKEGGEHGNEPCYFGRLGVGTHLKELLPDCLPFHDEQVTSYPESEESVLRMRGVQTLGTSLNREGDGNKSCLGLMERFPARRGAHACLVAAAHKAV